MRENVELWLLVDSKIRRCEIVNWIYNTIDFYSEYNNQLVISSLFLQVSRLFLNSFEYNALWILCVQACHAD